MIEPESINSVQENRFRDQSSNFENLESKLTFLRYSMKKKIPGFNQT